MTMEIKRTITRSFTLIYSKIKLMKFCEQEEIKVWYGIDWTVMLNVNLSKLFDSKNRRYG